MTISIINQDPPPDAIDISGQPFVRFSLTSNDPLVPVIQAQINVSYGGRAFFVSGQIQPGLEATIEANAGLGFDITMRQELPTDGWVDVDVDVGSFSESWKFRTGDRVGPRAISIVPTPFTDNVSTTPVVTFSIVDDSPGHVPVLRVIEQSSSDGELSASQLHSDTIDFRRALGRILTVDKPPVTEARVVLVLGPHDVVLETSGGVSGADVELFSERGLDVWVAGERVIHNGFDTSVDFARGEIDCNNDGIGVIVVDGDQFILDDGVNPARTYEFDTGGGITGDVAVDISASIDDNDVRDAVISAVNGDASLDMTAAIGAPGTGIVFLVNDTLGTAGNQPIDVTGIASPNFTTTNMTGGKGDWNASATPSGNQIDVTVTRIGAALGAGTRVEVRVLVSDDDPTFHNTVHFGWTFDVGDTIQPVLQNVVPASGSKGLVDAGPPDNLVFDIVDLTDDVDSTTIDIEVDGAAAVTAGAGVGDFSGSTVVGISGGFTVTLIKGTDWTDGAQVFVEVRADDLTGNSMLSVLNYHFGVTQDDTELSTGAGNLPENSTQRVVAFDLSETSFGLPRELRHSGYAYDGHFYSSGVRDDDSPTSGQTTAENLASWFTEGASANRSSQAEFPISGYVVATSGFWTILDQNGDMWMRCPVFGAAPPAWSMAGSNSASIVDADFGEDATLFVAGDGIIAVDFTGDRAIRYSTSGREVSSGNIEDRANNQGAGAFDPSYALTTDSVDRIGGVAFQRGIQRSQIAVACHASGVDIVAELSDEFLTLTGKEDPSKVVALSFTSPTWLRARISADDADGVLSLMLMRDESSQAKLSVYDWLDLFTGGSTTPLATFDNTNDLPAEAGADFDVRREPGVWLLAVATTDNVTIIEVASNGASSLQDVQRTLADLGMVFGTNPRLLSVAIEENFKFGLGHLYVSGTEDGAAGRVSRYREQSSTASAGGQVTQLGTDVVQSIDATGKSDLDAESLFRASMNVATEGISVLRASMDVA